MCIYTYTHIYRDVYNCGPISNVQGSKARSPRGVTSAKNDFWGIPVLEVSFFGLEDGLVGAQRRRLLVFGFLKRVLGASKTVIPYSTSTKNHVLCVFASKTPLQSTLEASWSAWGCSRSLPGRSFGVPLANLTGGWSAKFGFFSPRLVLAGFLALGWSLVCLFGAFFSRSEVVF